MEKKLGRNEPCWCGSRKKYKFCHQQFDERLADYERQGIEIPKRSMIKNPIQIEGIKKSAKINIAILDRIEKEIHVGMPTEEIDKIVYQMSIDAGAVPAPLHYNDYPKSVCTSINEQVCHGIPSPDILLQEGDIVNVDVSTILDSYFSDSSRMFCIGEVSEEKKRLVEVTKECVQKGLEAVKPWGRLGDVGYAVHQHALQNGYTVVKEIGGHGVGIAFHEDPWVSFTAPADSGMLLVPGMIFTIEPMVNMGNAAIRQESEDSWPVYTADGKPSAQWEIMVLVTEEGSEVLAW